MDETPAQRNSVRVKTHQTDKRVLIADHVSRFFITVGGIGTILAILGVCVFLVWVVMPLFQGARVDDVQGLVVNVRAEVPLHVACDEYQSLGWILLPSGAIRVFRMDTGQPILEKRLYEEKSISACSFTISGNYAALGFDDGCVALMEIGFETSYLEKQDVPDVLVDDLSNQPLGSISIWNDQAFQVTPEGQFRGQRLVVKEKGNRQVSDQPVFLIDLVERTSGPLICALTGSLDAPELFALSGRDKEDFLTGETRFTLNKPVQLPSESYEDSWPAYLEIAGTGADIYVAWQDGWFVRIRAESLRSAFIAERGRLVEPGLELTAMGLLLGETTLLWGDSQGNIRGGFPIGLESSKGPWLYDVRRDPEKTRSAFTMAKNLRDGGTPLRFMTSSSRSRLLACGFDDGTVEIYNPTQ